MTLAKTATVNFRYTFPVEAYTDATKTTLKYDFYRIEYTLTDSPSAYQATQVHIRNYGNTGYNSAAGRFGSSTEYIPLSNQTFLIYETSYGNGGFILQDYDTSSSSNGQTCTIQINSITFYVAPRYTVTFNWNYTGAATVAPVTNVWGGPLAGHPGYGVGTASWPGTPDRSSEIPPAYFVGWFDGATEVTSGTIITKNTDLVASWTNAEPPKVEKVTSKNNVAAPVYEFQIPTGVTWGNIRSVTYTLYVSDSTTFGATVRPYLIGSLNTGTIANTGVFPGPSSGWGNARMLFRDNEAMSAYLARGTNSAGQAGKQNEWVTITWNVSPLASSYGTTTGVTIVSSTTNQRTYYLAVVGGCVAGGTAISYYIKDVALVGTDGTKYPATPFCDSNGYLSPDPVISGSTKTLKSLSFIVNNSGYSASDLVREMAYDPAP